MINQYDKVALCSVVLNGKVRYFKEYSLNGRIVDTEYIPYSEFVSELWKKAGYREKQKLVGNSKKVRKVQDGLYSFAGIEFTYGMAGYKDFTIISS